MSKAEPEKILDLYLLPWSFGPFKNLGEYLLWKFSTMRLGEVFRLPIFSAFKVSRFAEGYALENILTGQLWATQVMDYPKLLDFIETQRPQTKPNMFEKALIRYVTANKLHKQGKSTEEIAKTLKTSLYHTRHYIQFGNLELMQ